MGATFVIEAMLLAAYGQLLSPSRPVTYLVPYTSIMEIYEILESTDQIMADTSEEFYARNKMKELLKFTEEPLNKKKIERALMAAWRVSPPLPINDMVSMVVINAQDDARYGEQFDMIETQLLIMAFNEKTAILTDQYEFIELIIEQEIPVQVFDLDDFTYALEEGITI